MQIIIISIVIFVFLLFLFFYFQVKKGMETQFQNEIQLLRKEITENLNQNQKNFIEQMKIFNEQINGIQNRMDLVQKNIGDRLDSAARVIGDVKMNLGSLQKVTEEIKEIGKDISSLEEILKPPKLRGELGEFLLTELLSQILPKDRFETQYTFRSGVKVDAIIKLEKGIVPVDAKFPLSNFRKILSAENEKEREKLKKEFQKDVQKHVDDIANKYIKPDEGTLNFAIMYIPAENVYYEIILKDEEKREESISSYAIKKRVIPVSPNSFYAYLQAILMGLQGIEIEKKAEMIWRLLQELKISFGRFNKEFEVLGTHIKNAGGKYEDIRKEIDRFNRKLEGVKSIEIEKERAELL